MSDRQQQQHPKRTRRDEGGGGELRLGAGLTQIRRDEARPGGEADSYTQYNERCYVMSSVYP